MEATFQSYLTEAVYEAVASTRGGSHQRDQISFIDDSDGEQQQLQQNQLLLHQQQQQPPPPLPVKMRVKNAAAGAAGGRHRGPRPSGILEQQQQDPSPITSFRTSSSSQPPASSSNPSAIPFWPPPRHSKFGLSVKRRLSPNSSSNFYLQRSQSTKEVGSNFSLFKNFGLKRTPTWSSVVAHLNRSFRAASATSNETSTADSRRNVEGGSKPDKVWKRSQSCRNIERLFYNRRYYHNEKFSLNSVSLFEDYIWYIHMGKCMAFKARKMGSVNR